MQALAEKATANVERTRVMAEKADTNAKEARGLVEQARALNERGRELNQSLEGEREKAARITSFNMLLLGTSSYLSCSHLLEYSLTQRELDAEACRSRHAAMQEDRRIMSDRYETARSNAVAGPNAEREVVVLDATESAAGTLHDLMVDWYTSIEDAGWPTGQPSPEGIWPARQALFRASGALSPTVEQVAAPADSPADSSADSAADSPEDSSASTSTA